VHQCSAPALSDFALRSQTQTEAAGDSFGLDPKSGKDLQPPHPAVFEQTLSHVSQKGQARQLPAIDVSSPQVMG